jgi:hypothetical protein
MDEESRVGWGASALTPASGGANEFQQLQEAINNGLTTPKELTLSSSKILYKKYQLRKS